MSAVCVDNYVVSCNPAPKTPVAELIVDRVTTLAATGADLADVFAWISIGLAVVALGLALLSLHFSNRARRIRRRAGRPEVRS